ncbi:dTDP-4-dehydrorhamnose reductase [Microbulbifer sp. GL-2]|uniref:dTDP-4-dehydrorhamnose reductase n=1 Tax=Microbulbifer sp. GL-2 TaxID=2591606 RepID=UPI001164FD74|nr:dTDP-4-dehydrorhamnose reductase [Microbulbifer sp. GL-2]BBM00394.1 NAD(P)-dependent oxidoreductase [Microbulbifer sp. GL-2]
MRILVTGKNGQLASELQQQCPVEYELVPLAKDELDISNKAEVMNIVERIRPDVIINSAAYTGVDKAEQERDTAFAVNTLGAENLAFACKHFNVRLLHVSTDFVFDGAKSSPYLVSDAVSPVGIYGASKAEAETAIRNILPEAIILRTSWVYAAHGNNFSNTMLRLMSERDQLGIVADQIGTPTWTGTIAEVLFTLVGKQEVYGIYHCTDLGVASWYDFAVAIFEEGKEVGLIPAEKGLVIKAITTKDYPTPAKRPAYSVLDKTRLVEELGIELRHWRASLRLAFSRKAKGLQSEEL